VWRGSPPAAWYDRDAKYAKYDRYDWYDWYDWYDGYDGYAGSKEPDPFFVNQ
jgi:hypothetical protein